jgi:apolipoprotein N-acyltransferase
MRHDLGKGLNFLQNSARWHSIYFVRMLSLTGYAWGQIGSRDPEAVRGKPFLALPAPGS